MYVLISPLFLLFFAPFLTRPPSDWVASYLETGRLPVRLHTLNPFIHLVQANTSLTSPSSSSVARPIFNAVAHNP